MYRCRATTVLDVVQAVNLMAALNPNIKATMIDGGVFPDEVKARNIMAVPAGVPERRALCQRQNDAGGNSE